MNTPNINDFGPEYNKLNDEYQQLKALYEAQKLVTEFDWIKTHNEMMIINLKMHPLRMKKYEEIRKWMDEHFGDDE